MRWGASRWARSMTEFSPQKRDVLMGGGGIISGFLLITERGAFAAHFRLSAVIIVVAWARSRRWSAHSFVFPPAFWCNWLLVINATTNCHSIHGHLRTDWRWQETAPWVGIRCLFRISQLAFFGNFTRIFPVFYCAFPAHFWIDCILSILCYFYPKKPKKSGHRG